MAKKSDFDCFVCVFKSRNKGQKSPLYTKNSNFESWKVTNLVRSVS